MPSCQEQLPPLSVLFVRRSICFFTLQQHILAAQVFPRERNDRTDTVYIFRKHGGFDSPSVNSAACVAPGTPTARVHPKTSCGRKPRRGRRHAGARRQLGHPHSGTSQLRTRSSSPARETTGETADAPRWRWFRYLSVYPRRRREGSEPAGPCFQSSGCRLPFAV